MRQKLALSALPVLIAAPAFAHPEHGTQLPDLLHVATQPDHLAIAFGAVILMAIIGRFAFKNSKK